MIKIEKWSVLTEEMKKNILLRPNQNNTEDLKSKVKEIINQVRQKGDSALLNFTQKFDKVDLASFYIKQQKMAESDKTISYQAKEAIDFAYQQIKKFHLAQKQESKSVETIPGIVCERRVLPIERVGLYVPGGTAPLVSTLLMLGVPSLIAENPLRIICTPPNQHGEVDAHLLYAASLCQIESVYKVGGAQAIAAMAYGTETIPKVDKIFGPGNSWVTQAKQLVATDPGGSNIDMPAGPSELMILADETARSEVVAADLLSQAEHNVDSQVILVTNSFSLAQQVQIKLIELSEQLPRRKIIEASLQFSRIIFCEHFIDMVTIANQYAAEHLILNLKNAESFLNDIPHAGTIFVGPWAAETLGDYVTGSNHVLPTHGFVKSHSGLSLDDFMRKQTIQRVTQKGFQNSSLHAAILAELEGLQAHQLAVNIRINL